MTSVFSIDLKKYTKGNKIGSGAFGDVFEIQEKETANKFAAKISKHTIDFEDPTILSENLKAEVSILSSLTHPGILKFIGFSKTNFEDNLRPTIITELLQSRTLGALFEFQHKGFSDPKFDSTFKHIALFGIASTMKYLHQNKIVHKDLKPDNILFDEFMHPKVCDFGVSAKIRKKTNKESPEQKEPTEQQKSEEGPKEFSDRKKEKTEDNENKDNIKSSSEEKKESKPSQKDESEQPPEFDLEYPRTWEEPEEDSENIHEYSSLGQQTAGTFLYMAPEIINDEKNPFSEKSDVYAF